MDQTVSDIKYLPLDNRITIDEQQNTAKFSTSQNENELIDRIRPHKVTDEVETCSNSFKLKNENKLLSLLPDIKFKNNSTTRMYTDRERCKIQNILMVVTSILVFVTIILIILLLHKNSVINNLNSNINDYDTERTKEKHPNASKICLTDKCILLSGNILNSMNPNVDPCEDFYEYSCGNWLKHTLIPRGYPRWSTIVSRTYANQLVLKEELEKYGTSNDGNLTDAENKAVLFYKSCIDTDGNIEKLKAKPMMDIISKFLVKNGENNLVFNESFDNILYLTHIEYGLSPFFQLSVMDDDKNSSFNDIEVCWRVDDIVFCFNLFF
jgi:hypothetical protein